MAQVLRIITVCNIFPFKAPTGDFARGGGAVCYSQLAQALHERGHHVEVVTRADPLAVGEMYRFPIHRAWVFPGFSGFKMASAFFLAPALFSTLWKTRFDVIHSNNAASAALSIIASKAFGLLHVVTFHDHWAGSRQTRLEKFFARWLESMIVHNVDFVTSDSRSVCNELARIHKVKRSKMRVIPFACDTEFFSPSKASRASARKKLGLPPKAEIVLFAGRLVAEKGLEYFLEAIPLVLKERKNAFFLVIGSGPEQRLLSKWLETSPAAKKVRVIPHVPLRLMPTAYAACDVFIRPSFSEGICRAITEAFSMQRPVVATRAGGTQEILKKEFGILVPPKDTASLARAIASILSDKRKAERMGKAARVFAEKSLSVKARADAFEKLLSDLMRRRR